MSSLKFFAVYALLFLSASHAFNLKKLLFGDSIETADQLSPSTTATFGAPIAKQTEPSRSDIPCSNYICKDTQTCVEAPVDCPCRSKTDRKCQIGNWYICINGDELCDNL